MQFDQLKRREFITLIGGVAGLTASSRPENGPNCSLCSQSIHQTGLGSGTCGGMPWLSSDTHAGASPRSP
jgi:hypothetical protein